MDKVNRNEVDIVYLEYTELGRRFAFLPQQVDNIGHLEHHTAHYTNCRSRG
jgi:hypothetical protein